MRGAEFVNNMEDRKLRREQAQQQEQRAAQSHALQVEGAEQQRQLTGMRIDQINEENAAKMNRALAWSLYNAKNMPQEYQQLVAAHPNLDASRLMSDEYGSALDTLEKASKGEIDYRSPEVGKAFDLVNPEIQLGATGGRKVATKRLYPGRTPGTLMVGLAVDGDPSERPLTERRSADPDDPVKEVPLDLMIDRVVTAKKYREYLLSPQGREAFIRQNIGDELSKAELQNKKLSLEAAKASRSVGQDAWGPIQYDEKTGAAYQANANGQVRWGPKASGPGGSGGGKTTQRQLDYRFAIDQMGMDQSAALEWASSDKTPTERAEAYANRMVQAEVQSGAQPDGYVPADSWKAHREQFMQAYGSYGGDGAKAKPEPKPTPAPPPLLADPSAQQQGATQPRKAPQAAIEALRKNPSLKAQFQEFYGYTPDGF